MPDGRQIRHRRRGARLLHQAERRAAEAVPQMPRADARGQLFPHVPPGTIHRIHGGLIVQKLKVQRMGDNCQGVRLYGDPDSYGPEPEYFRVVFPGGDVDITRTTDGDYWVHLAVNHPEHPHRYPTEGVQLGRVRDGRIDRVDQSVNETDHGDLGNANVYHIAARVEVLKQAPDYPKATKERHGMKP
jgi:hypothetical protein